MTVAIGDVLRVTAKMSAGLEDIQNVYHFQASGTGTATDVATMDGIAEVLDDAYTNLLNDQTTGLTYDSIEFFNITQDRPMGEEAWPVLENGSSVAELLPLQCAAVCLFGTLAPRSQGRKFLPPMKEETSNDSGLILESTVTAILLYIVDILFGVVVESVVFKAGNWNSVLERFAVWVSGQVNPVYKTQRRRVLGVGS